MFKETTEDDLDWAVNRSAPVVRPSDSELDLLVEMIGSADNITLYAGIGARYAHHQVMELARTLSAPVVHTSRAKEFIEPDNPFNIGMTGILGNRAGLEAILECDLLICLGNGFAYTRFYPEKAKIIQIDIDAMNIGRRSPVHFGLQGDVAATIQVLLPRLQIRTESKFLNKALQTWEKDQEDYVHRAKEPDPALIHPQFVTQTLDRLATDDAAFTADGCSLQREATQPGCPKTVQLDT